MPKSWRITATTIECFHDHQRVASHPRLIRDRWHTLPDPMPPAHRAMTEEWNPDYFQRRAAQIGPQTAALVTAIFARAVVPEQMFRRCQGILGLAHLYPPARLEQAATQALS